MGCFNLSCAVSGLNIREHQKVMAICLVKQKTMSMHERPCYTNNFYSPFILPFYGEYNDYGALENCTGAGLPLLLQTFKNQFVEVDNFKKENFDIKMLFDSFLCGKLRLNKSKFGQVDISIAYIREDVVNMIMEIKYEKEDFNYFASDAEALIKAWDEFKKRSFKDTCFYDISMFRSEKDFHCFKLLSCARGGENGIGSIHLKFKEILDSPFSVGERKNLIIEVMKIEWINWYMSSINKLWIPPMTAGQWDDYTFKPMKLLSNFILKEIKNREKEKGI